MARILLVDDDADIRKLAQNVLVMAGFEVCLAQDVNAAIILTDTIHFDVIVSDANMPVLTGFDLVRHLRAQKKFKLTPIALLTGLRAQKDVEMALKVGVDDYIVKPIDADMLVTKVQSLLKKRAPELNNEIFFQNTESESRAHLLVPIQLKSISEFGLSFVTESDVEVGNRVHVDLPLFREIGMSTPALKVLSKQTYPHNDEKLIHVIFLGSSDSNLQRLRAWINTRLLKKRSAEGAA